MDTGTTSAPTPGAWPLSAATTALLRDPRTPGTDLLRLSLRELVAVGAVRATLSAPRRGRSAVLLRPGAAVPLSRPLPLLDDALRPQLPAEGREAVEAVRAALGPRRDLPQRLLDAAREELADRGLLRQERDRVLGLLPRTRWSPTPSGLAWARSSTALPPRGVLPAVGLLLLLDPAVRAALREREEAELLTVFLSDDLTAGLDGAVDAGGAGGGDGGGGD